LRDDQQRLLDILDAIKRIEKYAAKGRDTFFGDELIQIWIVHHLETIGEACRGVSDDFKAKHTGIDWKSIIGMRTILAHKYFDIDLDIVWSAVESDLPNLKREVESVLQMQGH